MRILSSNFTQMKINTLELPLFNLKSIMIGWWNIITRRTPNAAIEQVKMLPEPPLAGDFTENYTKQAKPKDKQAFFALAGKPISDQYT